MPGHPARINRLVALILISATLSAAPVFAQSRTTGSDLQSDVEAGAASIVVAGNIGWRFNKGLTLTGGYTGVPGSWSLVSTFPFFQPTHRSMADNFFRPGFTRAVWANGEPVEGLNYLAFVGNGLNTLNISANKIDTNLLLAGSVWWEPLGPYSQPGKSWQM